MLCLIVFALTCAGAPLVQHGWRSPTWFPATFAAGAFLLTVAFMIAVIALVAPGAPAAVLACS